MESGSRVVVLFACALSVLAASCATAEPDVAPAGGPAATGAGGSASAPATRAAPTSTDVAESVDVPEELGLEEAFALALRANKDIQVASVEEEIGEKLIMGAEGEFDAVLFSEVSRGRDFSPVSGVPLERTDDAVGAAEAGVQKRFITGTDVEVSATTDYVRDIDGTGGLNPTWDSGLVLSLTQDLLRDFGPRVNRTRIVVARNNWKISAEELRRRTMDTLLQVEGAYWDLYFAERDLEVRRQQLERARRLVDRAQAYVEVGTSPPLDITRARSSAARQEVNIHRARNAVKRARHRLLRLMGVIDPARAGGSFSLTDTPSASPYRSDLEEAVGIARRNRPDYRQTELGIRNAARQRDFARNQRLPRLELFGEYGLAGIDDEFSGSEDVLDDGDYGSWQVGLRFEFPIPNRTARSDYAVARLRHRRAEIRRDSLLEQITREVADALADLEAADERLKTAQEARTLSEKLLEAEEKSFNLGRSNSLDVLDAQAALATAERDEARAASDYATALASLLRVEGVLLEARGVSMAGAGRR